MQDTERPESARRASEAIEAIRRGRPIHLCEVSTLEKATRSADELAVYAVDALVSETDGGYSLFVIGADVTLARDILGLPVEPAWSGCGRTRAVKSRGIFGRSRFSLAVRPLRNLALVAATGATLSLGVAAGWGLPVRGTGVENSSGWSGSRLAYHDDGNGDRVADRLVELGEDGRTRAIWLDTDLDGRLDRLIRVEPNVSATAFDLDEYARISERLP